MALSSNMELYSALDRPKFKGLGNEADRKLEPVVPIWWVTLVLNAEIGPVGRGMPGL